MTDFVMSAEVWCRCWEGGKEAYALLLLLHVLQVKALFSQFFRFRLCDVTLSLI